MLLGLLLTLNILVCLALIAVVLLQRSEGGALGSGSPTGLITTRGAGDLLTRTTWILFGLFLTISLALTLIGGRERSSQAIINRLKLQAINPDSLPTPTAPATPGTTSAPPSPNQAIPPAVQLPPLAGGHASAAAAKRAPSAPVPHSSVAQTIHAAPLGGATSSSTLSLPPLASPPPPAPAAPAPKP